MALVFPSSVPNLRKALPLKSLTRAKLPQASKILKIYDSETSYGIFLTKTSN